MNTTLNITPGVLISTARCEIVGAFKGCTSAECLIKAVFECVVKKETEDKKEKKKTNSTHMKCTE